MSILDFNGTLWGIPAGGFPGIMPSNADTLAIIAELRLFNHHEAADLIERLVSA